MESIHETWGKGKVPGGLPYPLADMIRRCGITVGSSGVAYGRPEYHWVGLSLGMLTSLDQSQGGQD